MNLVAIHQCLYDRARLHILHALAGGPLWVCQLQEILGELQVKISKHLPFDDSGHAAGTDEKMMAAFRRTRDEMRRVFQAYADGRRDAVHSISHTNQS